MKASNKVCNNPMKICFKHKTRMKIDYKIKDVRFYFFYHVDCDLWLNIFCHEFFLFEHANIFKTFIVACICLKGGSNKWWSLHYVCIIWNKIIERISESKKCNIPQNVFPNSFFTLKKIFWCVLIIWLSFKHHNITIWHKP